MLNKEEIEEYKNTLEELASDENVYKSIKRAAAGTFEYIQQLETREQKLIDKLEEDKVKNKELYKNTSEDIKLYREAKINYAEEILSIVKDNKKTTFPKK